MVSRTGHEQAKTGYGLRIGIADFYRARYGDYLIAINCTFKKTFEYKLEDIMTGTDPVSGKYLLLPVELPPQSTVAFMRRCWQARCAK